MTTDVNLWALDLRPFPFDRSPRQPVGAHLIVAVRRERFAGLVRICACGREYSAGSHPDGWWSTRTGRPPLQRHAIRCGLDILDEQAAA